MVTKIGRNYKTEGIYVYVWLIHFVVQQKVTPHCKLTSKIFYKELKGKALEHDTESDNLTLINIFILKS